MSIIAFLFPLLSKYIRMRRGEKGKAFEIAALVIGSFDFYCIIFLATTWNTLIALAIVAIVCVIYAKAFND